MVQNLNGRLSFVYDCPPKQYYRLTKAKIKLFLLSVLVGIFLLPQIAYLTSITPENLIDLTNRERTAQGLTPLTANQLLVQAAEDKGQAILAAQAFSHTLGDRRFSSWVRDAGYNYSYVGENLAIDFNTGEGIIQAWNNSPLHKKNLLSPYYQEIGIAALAGEFQGQATTLVVQVFGAPATGAVQPLAANTGFNYLNNNFNLAPTELTSLKAEDLLTHAVINQGQPLPANEKISLSNSGYSLSQVNKFFVQPNYQALNNFLVTLASLILFYLLIYLYYYYFLKINKLISI